MHVGEPNDTVTKENREGEWMKDQVTEEGRNTRRYSGRSIPCWYFDYEQKTRARRRIRRHSVPGLLIIAAR